MKATLTKRHPPAASRPKRRPARRAHSARRHKKHAPKTEASVLTPVIVTETVTAEVETPSPFYVVEPDKRDEELSDEEMLDREERQDLY